MHTQSRSAHQEVARIAAGQHGVVTRTQLLEAGVSRSGLSRGLRGGRLHRVHPGVYRVGHRAPSTEARYLAAVLACGEDAVLSGVAAAYVFGLVKGGPPAPEVTALRTRRIRGVITHRVRRLDPRDVARYRSIPITTVARTVVDLAAGLTLDELARACHEGEVRHHLTQPQVEAMLARRHNPPGARNLHAIFDGDAPVLLSKLESAFLSQLRRARLQLPRTNRNVGGRYVDCRWPEHRLTVELDGYRYHHTRHAWEQDRRREREARARGDEFRRYTYGDVCEDRALMLGELRELLALAVGQHAVHSVVERQQQHGRRDRDHEAAEVGVVAVADVQHLGGEEAAQQRADHAQDDRQRDAQPLAAWQQ
jgi:very-short-patch-repair endonuclease